MHATGNMGLDANEDFVYFGITGQELAPQLPPGTKDREVRLRTAEHGRRPERPGEHESEDRRGEDHHRRPFQIGHVQTNPWVPGEIVFCWETGGKAPQRTWTVMSDGSGLRPLYPRGALRMDHARGRHHQG
jgi:oligogalacturonide lyase